jgi:hypothetical protein
MGGQIVAKNTSADDKGGPKTPEPVEVYPVPTSDSAGERTGNIAPSAQKPGVPPEEKKPTEKPVPTAGEAVANADAELVRLRARVAELEGEKAKALPAGEGKHEWTVGGPGTPERVVKADDEAGAKRAYMTALGIWSLPGDVSVVKGKPPTE